VHHLRTAEWGRAEAAWSPRTVAAVAMHALAFTLVGSSRHSRRPHSRAACMCEPGIKRRGRRKCSVYTCMRPSSAWLPREQLIEHIGWMRAATHLQADVVPQRQLADDGSRRDAQHLQPKGGGGGVSAQPGGAANAHRSRMHTSTPEPATHTTHTPVIMQRASRPIEAILGACASHCQNRQHTRCSQRWTLAFPPRARTPPCQSRRAHVLGCSARKRRRAASVAHLADGCLRAAGGGGGQRQHRARSQHGTQDVAQPEVGGPEGVAPLAHAVRLVHTHLPACAASTRITSRHGCPRRVRKWATPWHVCQ